jgi:two-component system, OmpR family, response regulator
MNRRLPRVFIVEDEPMVRDQVFYYLDDFDEFRLASAESGEEALLQLAEEPADVCIVDLRMPGMNGVDFIRAAKARALCRHFFVHTGVVDKTLELEMSALGLSERDILLKPVDLEKLLAKARAAVPSTKPKTGGDVV